MNHRVFIGLSVPRNIITDIQSLQLKLGKFDWPVVWEPEEKLHITLRFLGDITDNQLERVKEITERITADTK